jgi:hypothetical protein
MIFEIAAVLLVLVVFGFGITYAVRRSDLNKKYLDSTEKCPKCNGSGRIFKRS